jgi:signal transduction histidine kinase/ActR/RegA family two-component response regulator
MGQTFLELISNLGVLALVFVFYVALKPGTGQMQPVSRQVLFGVGFGAAASIVMHLPITLLPGIIFDTRGAPILLSGVFGGPISAIIATVIAATTRLQIGGVGAMVGVLSLTIYGVGSILFRTWLDRRGREVRLLEVLVFGTVVTALSTPVIYLLPSDIIARIVPVAFYLLLVGNFFGVLVLGSLLTMEVRRLRLVTELRTANTEAQAGIQAKDRFIASMNHQIRTPLNAVLGEGQLAMASPLPEEARRQVRQMITSARALLELLDDALAFARLSAGEFTVRPTPTDMRALLADRAQAAAAEATGRDITVTASAASGLPELVPLDNQRLGEVLERLLSNAVAHTASGSIALSANWKQGDTATKGHLEVSVTDTGSGIAPEYLSRIWSPFERGATGNITDLPGTGLGLTICRETIERMGGQIELQSTPGTGTSVMLTLPVEAAPNAPVISEAFKVEFRPGPPEPKNDVAAPENSTPRAASDRRVLVVDDIELNAQIAAAMLRNAGFDVSIAINGQEALDKLSDHQVDLILMDIQMPVMDGIEATKLLRQHTNDQIRSTPVIALTAHGSDADRDVCLSAGMNAFLRKPVEGNELVAVVKKFVK